MKRFLSTCSLGALMAMSSQAYAQTQSPASSAAQEAASPQQEPASVLDEIVVTAQKKSRAEAAQDVPVALTAFNAELLRATLSEDLRDVGYFSPNTQLLENATIPGVASFSIRGLGSQESTASVEASVGLIKDGVVYAQRFGSFIETFDLESVEILRGPQGTLFGRNVTGGVVVVRSRRPQLEEGVRGEVRGVLGSDERRDLMGYADLTLVPDTFGVLVSAATLATDGPIKNLNAIGGTAGDERVKNYRVAALYEPNDSFDLSLIVEHNENTSDTTPVVDPFYVTEFFTANRDLDNQIDLKTDSYVAEANLAAAGGVITAIAAYRDTTYGDNGPTDFDGGPTAVFHTRQLLHHDQTSLEVRYATLDLFDRLDFTVGAFWMSQGLDIVEARYRTVPTVRIQASGATQDTNSWAVFGQTDVYLTDTLTLTAGARYTQEEKDFNISPLATNECNSLPLYGTTNLPKLSDCKFTGEVSDDWEDFSPMVRLTWKPNDDFLAYGSVSRGFRSGGFNSRATSTGLINGRPVPYDDEVLTNYELGFKSDWFDRRFRFNGAVFYSQIDDLQRSVTGPPPAIAQTILNAGAAEISGIEFDTAFRLFEDGLVSGDSLLLTANYGYVKADYTFFDTNGDGVSDADQLDFSKVAPNTFAVSATYNRPLEGLGRLTARVAYRWEDEMATDTLNTRAPLAAYGEVDANLKFTPDNGRWSIAAFITNAADNESIYQVQPVAHDTIYERPGRRYGIELTANF